MWENIKKTAVRLYFSLIFLLVLVFLQIAYYSWTLPDKFYQSEIGDFTVSAFMPVIARNGKTVSVSAKDASAGEMDLMLYGLVPIKKVTVIQKQAPELTPLGYPFGLKILTDGVVVTDFGSVDGGSGSVCPAEESGVKIGDVIVSVNDTSVSSGAELLDAVQSSPGMAQLTVIRDGERMTLDVSPVRSVNDGLYKLGMWIKDSVAGIGTLTYYDSQNKIYGGLGHSVSDIGSGQILPIAEGQAVPVCISEVKKGCPGNPGELCGSFLSRRAMGSINLNTECGIFGVMEECPSDAQPLPMAYKQEVEIGEAVILTTVDGMEPEEYTVLIEKINYRPDNDVKNMVIRITDSRLLSITGGIVQGMSGSPIIQNGKLVGAVTHVFVNEVDRGYAIFAENMYKQSSELYTAESASDMPLAG